MCIFTYINTEYPSLSSELLASVHSVKQAQESLCDELFILESLLEGLEDGSLD